MRTLAPPSSNKHHRSASTMRAWSVTWRVVARLGVRTQRRKSLWWAQLDLDLSPPCVMSFLTWVIAQDVDGRSCVPASRGSILGNAPLSAAVMNPSSGPSN
jgi:hypothetical protein